MWQFNMQTQVWSEIRSYGELPSPRSGHATASLGDRIYSYGGGGSDKIYSDLHSFDTINLQWSELDFGDDLPPIRTYSCIAIAFPKLFVFGGLTSEGLSNDIWILDLESFKTEEGFSFGSGGPPNMSYGNCDANEEGDDFIFKVYTGLAEGDAPVRTVYSYSYNSQVWAVEGYSPALSGGSAAFRFNNKIVQAGGEEWGLYSSPQIFLIDFDLGTYVELGELPDAMFYMASAYHGTSIYLHGGSDTLFEKARLDVPSRLFYKVDLSQDCGEYCNWPCSFGTFKSSGECSLCPAGRYSDNYGEDCTPCPKGTASKRIGNTSRRQCYPCEYGYYSPEGGMSLCKECKLEYTCPIGSYSIQSAEESDTSVDTQQPQGYELSSTGVTYVTITVLSTGAFIALVFCVVCVCVSSNIRNKLRGLDIYTDKHNHFLKQPMILKTTNLGGIFSVFFMFAAVLYIIIAFYIYFEYNIEESKGLVPLATLQEDYDKVGSRQFTADISVYLKLENYGGACAAKVNSTSCSKKISLTTDRLYGDFGNTTCYKEDTSCVIELTCNNCEVQPGAEVRYALKEPWSFASGLFSNITSTSSIPDEISAAEQYIKPTTDKVMLGPNPWLIYFEMTPSVFLSDSSDWKSEETGYHVSVTTSEDRGSESIIAE